MTPQFPYGFPTSFSRRLKATDGQHWPRCINSEPGTYGHECGAPAAYIGTNDEGTEFCFCAACKMTGSEARRMKTFRRISALPPNGGLDRHAFELVRREA